MCGLLLRGLSYIMVELCCVVLMLFLAERRSAPEYRRPGTAVRKQQQRMKNGEEDGADPEGC